MKLTYYSNIDKYIDHSGMYPRPMTFTTALKKIVAAKKIPVSQAANELIQLQQDGKIYEFDRTLPAERSLEQIAYLGKNRFQVGNNNYTASRTLTSLLQHVSLQHALQIMSDAVQQKNKV